MAFSFEEALSFYGCHATGPGGGDGLAICSVLDVASVEDALNIGARILGAERTAK